MRMLSEDDVNLEEMTRDELDAAWDLWFDLAQSTNDTDPPFTHGVFVPTVHQEHGIRNDNTGIRVRP